MGTPGPSSSQPERDTNRARGSTRKGGVTSWPALKGVESRQVEMGWRAGSKGPPGGKNGVMTSMEVRKPIGEQRARGVREGAGSVWEGQRGRADPPATGAWLPIRPPTRGSPTDLFPEARGQKETSPGSMLLGHVNKRSSLINTSQRNVPSRLFPET